MSQSGGPRLRLEFWSGFRQFVADRSAITCGRASSETWMHHDARLNCGRLFSMIRTRDGEIGSQFALDDLTARTVFSLLDDHRREVDEAFGQPLTWLLDNLGGLARALGPFVGRSIPTPHRGDWDEPSFFAALGEHNPCAAGPARRLLEWGRASLPQVRWGHGKQSGSFTPGVLRSGVEHSLVSVWTDGLFCDRFQPAVFDRSTDEDWSRRGGKDATAVAAVRVDELLATHRPEPLPARAQEAVDAVLARALDRARRG